MRFGIATHSCVSCVSTFGSIVCAAHRSVWLHNPNTIREGRLFGVYNPHAIEAGPLSDVSCYSLVAQSCSLFNFTTSRLVLSLLLLVIVLSTLKLSLLTWHCIDSTRCYILSIAVCLLVGRASAWVWADWINRLDWRVTPLPCCGWQTVQLQQVWNNQALPRAGSGLCLTCEEGSRGQPPLSLAHGRLWGELNPLAIEKRSAGHSGQHCRSAYL